MAFIERPVDNAKSADPALWNLADAENGDDGQAPEKAPAEPPIRTQMVGETPEDDLGYDPNLIPTEPIEDDDSQ